MSHSTAGTTLMRDRCPANALGRYEDREIVAVPDECGGTLVIDQQADGADQRLVGRIHQEEPEGNAQRLAELYLADPTRGRCSPVIANDLHGVEDKKLAEYNPRWDLPLGNEEATFQLQLMHADGQAPAIRWTRTNGAASEVVSLRDVMGQLQDYQPAVAMTATAIRHHQDSGASTCVLRDELRRVHTSCIVLNRPLREAVQQAVADGLSLSEIAARCGRSKDHGQSGDTSWLARRIGQLPEAGKTQPTPWVHTDTLALIARDGLGVSPREVEVPQA